MSSSSAMLIQTMKFPPLSYVSNSFSKLGDIYEKTCPELNFLPTTMKSVGEYQENVRELLFVTHYQS